MNTIRVAIPIGVLVFGIGCDKAKDGLAECERLEAAGKLSEAVAACNSASEADPSTESGRTALSKAMDIQRKLDDIVPPTVTMEWCSRLRRRLEGRLTAQAEAEYGSGSETPVREYVLNLEYDCHLALGSPTAGLWTCRWNETFDNYNQCDEMDKHGGTSR